MDRRRFLLASAAAAALPAFAQSEPTVATIALHLEKPGAKIPANFIGLSYETEQLSDPAYFAPTNTGLIEQFRALAPHGVLRIGGSTSDVAWWKPTPSSQQPPLPPTVTPQPPSPGAKPFQELAYAVTPQAVVNLRAFLDATGWTCLYGINLATNTPTLAAEQAAFVAKTLGPHLEYFQLGNEPDGFWRRFKVKDQWTADAYFDEWFAAVQAILTRVPHARFGLPDTASQPEWTSRVADRLTALPDHSFVAALSHHHYFTGPPSNPKANPHDMLQPDPTVLATAAVTRAAAEKLNTLYRMTEGNTCYLGGKPGLSDVFASTLWAADYALLLAQLGYAGLNLHGGSGQAVANSLGGHLPGELLMADPHAPHPRPFYTPIAEIDGKYIAEPVFYGLLFAQRFAGATMVPLTFDPGAVNATAYAAKTPDGKLLLAIINKDENRDLRIDLPGGAFTETLRLTAPSLTSNDLRTTTANTRGKAWTIPRASILLLAQQPR
ncbi:hypothetical protein ACFQBQ_13505 [Granulicella cerasi]|uniref:Uncharacterized protein n=1 Tax=Granulicella cerasi TaxID=741063 RepID=A0ABW1ZEG5_9BACT|nr:hypothetical protein [Granulicella cerasi]